MTGADERRLRPLDAPLDAVIQVPGSKSITNRALIVAALAEGTSVLEGVLFADDTEAMLAALGALGVAITIDRAERRVQVIGTAGEVPAGPARLDARLSGTTARFLAPLLALGTGTYVLDGAEPLRARPMGDVLDALRALGAPITDLAQPGHLPVQIGGAGEVGLRGGEARLRADVSSQFTSALLLSAPVMPGGLTIRLDGPVVSQPYLDLTIAVMAAFGVTVARPDARTFVVAPATYRATRHRIEPDASAASYFFAAPMIAGGRVRVEGLGVDAIQGDMAFVDVLARMGAGVEQDATGTTITSKGLAHGVAADLTDFSDTAQTLAAVAVFADGPTTIDGIGFIRRKETDRIAAVATELARTGIQVDELPDGLRVHPGQPEPATIRTYDDHRMAMSFALLGLRAPGITIADPACVAKTFPDFWDVYESLRTGGNAAERTSVNRSMRVIAIDGPAGSGKSTVARAVAEALGLGYLDTGAMYRSVAFAALRRAVDIDEVDAVGKVAREFDLRMDPDGVVKVDGVDATIEIRGPEITRAVSVVAANPAVREEMRSRQREWATRHGGGVMEGRDIGTVVFPDAALKVYLDASPEVRAERRSKEVTDLSYETVAADIARRDAYDQGREHDPLRTADDAVVIDTSNLSVDQIVAKVLEQLGDRDG